MNQTIKMVSLLKNGYEKYIATENMLKNIVKKNKISCLINLFAGKLFLH